MRKFLSLFSVLVVYSISAFSQERIINGRITDSLGQPISFSSVEIKGTKKGVIADADGYFTIKASPIQTLVISCIGIIEKEVTVGNSPNLIIQVSLICLTSPYDAKVGNSTNLVIQVARSAPLLASVVVTGFGITRQAKSLGYTADQVSGEDINTAYPVNFANGLTAKVSGLEINTINNGLFAPTRITIRGNRSLVGYNQPLIVLNGTIFYNDISTINPEDIESVNILKGSSASAIYGADASNGVIVITTKHGSSTKHELKFSTTTQFETVAYLPSIQQQFGNGDGEIYIYNYNDLSTYIPVEDAAFGPQFNGKMVPAGRPLQDGSIQMIRYAPVPNQLKDCFNTGETETKNLSYSTGDKKGRFYLGFQDLNSSNPMPGDHGSRDIFRVGGARTFGIFSVDFSGSYTYQYKDQCNDGQVWSWMLGTPDCIPLSSYRDYNNNKFATPWAYYSDYGGNPFYAIALSRFLTTDKSLEGNIHLQLKPAKWLTLSYRLGANNWTENWEQKDAPTAKYPAYTLTNDTIYFSNANGTALVPNTSFGVKFSSGDWLNGSAYGTDPLYYSISNTSNTSIFLLTSDFLATFTTKFSKDFNFNFILGSSYIDNETNYLYVAGGTPSNKYYGLARKLGFFGDAQAGYKGFAYLHGSYRVDEDSRLSSANRWVPYYDVDASIIMSEIIPGMKLSPLMDYMKLRGAYSVTGNATSLGAGSPYLAAGAYKTLPSFATVFPTTLTGLVGNQSNTNMVDPNIKAEQVAEEEAGLEFGFLKSRIRLGVTVYSQKLSNGIVNASLPGSSGFQTATVNAANTNNKGYEIDLKGNIIQSANWVWRVNLNYSHNECIVRSIDGGLTSLNISTASGPDWKGNWVSNGNAYAVVGQPYPVLMGSDWYRDPQGHVIVNAVTGLPKISPDPVVLGNASPRDILGFSTSVSWKAFTLKATADYRGGYKVLNTQAGLTFFMGVASYTTQAYRQPFVFPNSVIDAGGGKYVKNTNTTVSEGDFQLYQTLFYDCQSTMVTSAAAWKLREVALIYNIPVMAFGHQKLIKQASLTVSGRNLLMIRPKTNLYTDPEFAPDTTNGVGSNGGWFPTRIWGASFAVTL